MRIYENAALVLTEWLSEHEMTPAQFAREIGIDAGILRGILNGKTKSISTRNMYLLARYFGVSMQQLMDTMG